VNDECLVVVFIAFENRAVLLQISFLLQNFLDAETGPQWPRTLLLLLLFSLGFLLSDLRFPKGVITSKIKHAVKHKTSPARLAQLLQPSLAFCFSLQPMMAYRPVLDGTPSLAAN